MISVVLGENPSDVALLSFTPELAVPDQHNKPWKINKASSADLLHFIIEQLSRLSAHQSRFKVCQTIFTRTEKEKLS